MSKIFKTKLSSTEESSYTALIRYLHTFLKLIQLLHGNGKATFRVGEKTCPNRLYLIINYFGLEFEILLSTYKEDTTTSSEILRHIAENNQRLPKVVNRYGTDKEVSWILGLTLNFASFSMKISDNLTMFKVKSL